MKEVLHQTKDTPLNPLSSSREQRTEGTCPPLPSVCERVAKARGVGGVPKRVFAKHQFLSIFTNAFILSKGATVPSAVRLAEGEKTLFKLGTRQSD